MRTFLGRITGLTPIAAGAAAAMVVLGIVSIIGGSYDHQVVREQLGPQKIFPKPAEWPALESVAGEQVLTGAQAQKHANDQLAPDLNKVAGGLTYSQVSEKWIAGGMKNEKLAGERTTLFMGETLKGLLLGAWGWAQIGSIAMLAGILLIALGGLLFLLPMLNWWLNLRGEPEKAASRRSTQTSPVSAPAA